MRAKFLVESLTNHAGGSISVLLSPAKQGPDDTENNEFWKYTPSGSLDMTITNPNANDFFEPGKYYYLDFKPVEYVAIP